MGRLDVNNPERGYQYRWVSNKKTSMRALEGWAEVAEGQNSLIDLVLMRKKLPVPKAGMTKTVKASPIKGKKGKSK